MVFTKFLTETLRESNSNDRLPTKFVQTKCNIFQPLPRQEAFEQETLLSQTDRATRLSVEIL